MHPARSRDCGYAPARIFGFSGAAILIASTAHYLGHGQFPGLPMLLTLALGTGCIGLFLSRSTRGPWSIGLGLVFSQALMHLALSHSTSPCFSQSQHARHELAKTLAVCTPHTAAPSGRMLLWHTAAIVVTAIILAFAEKSLARLANFFKPRVPQRPSNLTIFNAEYGYAEPLRARPGVAQGGCCLRGPPRVAFSL